MRFGRATRKILTALFIVVNLFFSPLIMYIPSLAFAEGNTIDFHMINYDSTFFFVSSVTKFNVQIINIVVSYVCVIYTMLGGIKAVVWTDVSCSINLSTFFFSFFTIDCNSINFA